MRVQHIMSGSLATLWNWKRRCKIFMSLSAPLMQQQCNYDWVIAYANRLLSIARAQLFNQLAQVPRSCMGSCKGLSTLVRSHIPCHRWPPRSLLAHKDSTGQLTRQGLSLQEYTFSVLYKTGCLHWDGDCLSCYLMEEPVDDIAATCILSVSHLLRIGDEQHYEPSLTG